MARREGRASKQRGEAGDEVRGVTGRVQIMQAPQEEEGRAYSG